MGRSMAALDPAREPADAVYEHSPSRSRFQIVRKDGQLWHRELLQPAPSEVVLEEYPMAYVIGSGRHSRSYLVEIDGFLVESPVTWYTAKSAWGMSPGYAVADHPGFQRATGEGCLSCHAGRAEAVDGSLHRMAIVEAAIGCERCHGPGSLHVARRQTAEPVPRPDHTIVNPARLPRELAESICQQCHLRTTAVVVARGRTASDFRPGLPLQDFLHAFEADAADGSMTVVGHVEQMHRSRCYTASATLTCLTCHDPHNEPQPGERPAHYRAVCLTCHQPDRCTVAPALRQRESPANDCTHCHMPRSPTEIPHLAFTHHRIGVHGRPPEGRPAADVELRAFHDLSRFAEIDRQRSRGLAFLEAANREPVSARAERYRSRSLDLLLQSRTAGLRDPVQDTALARLAFDTGRGDPLAFADDALALPGLVGQDRCNALFVRADALAGRGDTEAAIATLRTLVTLRRQASDWLLRADCENKLGHEAAGLAALEMAVRINPRLWKVHRHLAETFQRQGNAERAAWHRLRAVP
jgi:hypothetical protein